VIVSAGDLEKYAYCPLSWWISKKHKSVSKEGIKKHKELEKELKEIKKGERRIKLYEKYILFISILASFVAIAGISFLYGEMAETWNYFFISLSLIWLFNSAFFLYRASRVIEIMRPRYEKLILISSMGAMIIAFFSIIFSLPKNPNLSRFLEILALLWVIAANLLFYHSLYISEKLLSKKIRYAPLKSNLEYIGAIEGEEIVSTKYGIRGKPDYIIKLEEDYIPIEEKTADLDTPPFPHVIQLTAYCMLIEDKYGKAPPYGIIRYKNYKFKIPYEKRWKDMVISFREKMIEDLKRGKAHRNHFNKNKCKSCIRKEYCNERLV